MPGEWTDAEIELLSAYIDGQLDESDRTALEARLADDADLRQELAAMRQTVALLRDLPTIRAPRAFTLTPEMVGQTAAPAAATELRVLPPTKQARPRRVWWVPAASAAGVVLLAGVFFVMTQQNTSGAVQPDAARQGVAVAATSTVAVQVGSELNTIVQQSVTQVQIIGETSDTTPNQQGSNTGAAQPEGESDDASANEQAPSETLLSQATAQLQNQVTLTQVGAPIAPPGEQPAPRAASPTAMPTATVTVADIMVMPLPTQIAPTFSDPKMNQPSGGGGSVPIAPEMTGGYTPGAVAGMDTLNTNPNAPGFTVATMSPIQGTAVAQYSPPQLQVFESEPAELQESAGSDQVDEEVSPTEISAASSAAQDAPEDGRTTNEPIWVYWFNVLSDWLLRALGQ